MEPRIDDRRRRAEGLIAQTRAAQRRFEQRSMDAEASWQRLQDRKAAAHREMERLLNDGAGMGAVGRFLLPCVNYAAPGGILAAGLRAMMELTCTGMGNVQLFQRGTGALTIAAHHGFDRFFLNFFAFVTDDRSVCGRAMAARAAVAVHDVERDARLADTPAMRVLRASGVRAVHSTPLLGRHGEPLGVVSVHYPAARTLTRAECDLLGPLCHRLGRLLEVAPFNDTPSQG